MPERDYRADIDGLRAVAVSAVILFHAWPGWLTGGFIGVDIFFVISGYLITGIILKQIERGRFSYLMFFGRRIRRIGPALAVVLLASLAAGFFIVPYGEFRSLGLQATAAAGFSANILFWMQSGYFDALASSKPLLHLWSLGVEEQFYIVWPLLLVLASTWRVPWRISILVVIALSFLANLLLIGRAPEAAFYLLPGRLWELGLGGLLARHHSAETSTRWAAINGRAKALAGILLIVGSALFFYEGLAFPGWWACVPTFGAMLIIDAGPATPINRMLGRMPLKQIGLISYPMYLWHWPIFVFGRQLGYTGALWKTSAILGTVVLAFLTYLLVERPIRFGALSLPKHRVATAFSILVALLGAGALGEAAPAWQVSSFGLPLWAKSGLFADYASYKYYEWPKLRQGTCLLTPKQTGDEYASECFGDRADRKDLPLVLVWGDSLSATLYPGFLTRQRRQDPDFRIAQLTASACPPIFGVEYSERPNCRSAVDAVERAMTKLLPDTVIMHASWPQYTAQNCNMDPLVGVFHTIKKLFELGIPHIVVIGPKERWDASMPGLVLSEMQKAGLGVAPERISGHTLPGPEALEPYLRNAVRVAGAKYISALETLCNDQGCLASVGPEDHPMPYDLDEWGHFTEEGSSDFVNRIWTQLEPEIPRRPLISADVIKRKKYGHEAVDE